MRRIGYVIQDGGLFPHLTATDNVALLADTSVAPAARGPAPSTSLPLSCAWNPRCFCVTRRSSSGGERQRVGIMRALMLDPPLLLLDEPMGALDPMVRAPAPGHLKRIFAELEKTVILVTHSLDEAAFLGDEVVLMRDGRVVQRGTMRDLESAGRSLRARVRRRCSAVTGPRAPRRLGLRPAGGRSASVALALALLSRVAVPRGAGRDALRSGPSASPSRTSSPRSPRQTARSRGASVTHEQGLGGTAVVFRALEEGSIDVYPEYTGTLAEAVLHSLGATAATSRASAAPSRRGASR